MLGRPLGADEGRIDRRLEGLEHPLGRQVGDEGADAIEGAARREFHPLGSRGRDQLPRIDVDDPGDLPKLRARPLDGRVDVDKSLRRVELPGRIDRHAVDVERCGELVEPQLLGLERRQAQRRQGHVQPGGRRHLREAIDQDKVLQVAAAIACDLVADDDRIGGGAGRAEAVAAVGEDRVGGPGATGDVRSDRDAAGIDERDAVAAVASKRVSGDHRAGVNAVANEDP